MESTQSSHVQSLSYSHRLPLGLVQVRLGQKDEIGEFVGGSLDGV